MLVGTRLLQQTLHVPIRTIIVPSHASSVEGKPWLDIASIYI